MTISWITPPTITAGTATGTITSIQGTPSASPNIQQFTVSGAALTGNIVAIAPTNFEISTASGSGYATSLTLPQTSGTVNTTTVYVRSSASAPASSISGNVSLTSTGASTKTVAVAGTISAPICGAGLSGPTWTGCVSTDWNTAGNWASGAVPTATDDVVIPSAPASQPVISTTAVAKSVEVQTGASLSIASAGVLVINGFKTVGANTMAFYNAGTVANSGLLLIGNSVTANVGKSGIFNKGGTFQNNTGGSIAIDRTTDEGIFVASGSFTNAATITIGAVASVGEYGIWNNGIFLNDLGGRITIDQTTDAGLVNSGGNSAIFTNSATIIIRVGGNGIKNNSLFQNTGCGALINVLANAVISNSTGQTFNNTGTIIENAGGTSNISTNTGVIQNLNGGTFTVTGTNTGVLTTSPGLLWTGCTSTDWNTATNWSGGTVPLATDDVVIVSGPASQPLLGTAAVAKSVEVQSGASLSISSAGSLTINNSRRFQTFTASLWNKGRVVSGGQLIINNPTISVYGLVNSGNFDNVAGGQISIDGANSVGLHNISGSFVNSATITIGKMISVGQYGVFNTASFNNSGCSALLWVVSDAIISNSSTFSNTGTIIENASGNSSISSNEGLVQNLNDGTFSITGTPNTGLVTTIPGSLPTITATPSLTINQGQSANLTVSGALSYSWSTGETTPAITVSVAGPYSVTGTIGSCATVATVTLTVTAPVCGAGLSGPTWTGCVSRDWNTAGNWASGAVPTATDDVVISSAPASQPVISTTAVAKSMEVQSGASLNISSVGSLTINGSKIVSVQIGTTAFVNRGTVSNGGQLVIGNTASVGNFGLYNLATFENGVGGRIQIDNSTLYGLLNGYGSRFTNSATITIGATARVGSTGLYNLATFENGVGGRIQIDNSTGGGIYNAGDGRFTNSAMLIIGATAAVGLYGIYNKAMFENQAGGYSQLDNSTYTSLYNQNDGTFINSATITIGSLGTVGGTGIRNEGPFANSACATLTVLAPIFNYSNSPANINSFSNAGLITINTAQAHNNTRPLINNGIIAYPQGNPLRNVTNNAVIAGLTASLTPTFSPALQLGVNSGQFSIGTTWYSDAALTQPAGSYNQGTNTFTALAAPAPGSSKPLYFAATDGANSCPKTVTITLVGSSLPTPILRVLPAASPSTILTTGTTTLSATASGGIGPYTYSFSGPGTIVQTGNMATVSGLPAGVQSFTVLVIDSDPFLNQKASDVVSVTVNAVPVVVPVPTALTLTASASLTTIFANGSTTLSASASGGTPGYSYSFSGPGTISQSGNTAMVSGLPVGVQTFTVSVQDATSPAKQSVSRVVSVTVNAVPTVPPVVVPPVAVPFSATVVSYNCQTGVLVLGSVGSSPGPAVEYAIPGVTNFTSGATFVLNEGLRRDARSLTISVQQGGVSGASFVFDLRAFCTGGGQPTPVPTPTPTPPIPTTALSATVLSYNCGTGNLVVGSTGGTGTAVEYAIPGVSGFTTTNTFTLNEGLRRDASQLTINVRQGGVSGMPFVFNFRSFCPGASARFGAGEPVSALMVTVLGNPVSGEAVVEIGGAAGASVQMRLVDLTGVLVESRSVPVAGAVERQVFDLRQAPSVVLLQVSGAGQSKTVKIVQE